MVAPFDLFLVLFVLLTAAAATDINVEYDTFDRLLRRKLDGLAVRAYDDRESEVFDVGKRNVLEWLRPTRRKPDTVRVFPPNKKKIVKKKRKKKTRSVE